MWFADLNRRFNYVMDGDLNWARASLRARFNFRLQMYVYANSNYDLMNSLDLELKTSWWTEKQGACKAYLTRFGSNQQFSNGDLRGPVTI